MLFVPKNGAFYAYEKNTNIEPMELSPKLFTTVIYRRSKEAHTQRYIDMIITDYFMKQIDMTHPDAFTLSLVPFNEWYTIMDDLNEQT